MGHSLYVTIFTVIVGQFFCNTSHHSIGVDRQISDQIQPIPGFGHSNMSRFFDYSPNAKPGQRFKLGEGKLKEREETDFCRL